MTEEANQWELLRTGETRALEYLYKEHIDGLYQYGIVLCGDADKVKNSIHDLFITIWQGRERLAMPDSVKAYLLVSLRRKLFDKGSRIETLTEAKESFDELNISTEPHDAHWVRLEDENAEQAKLEKAMSRLSERQREIIHMKYFQELEYEEIGRIMDLNYQSARNLVTRALTVLRKEMLLTVIILLMSL
ncbi:MAG: sigma-70 family RNA polymerase sigma factor [Bacteroidota bacterium]|nr:sigma-70 family RNA polymerase sigma factor [Bacteroidota bacterium]